MLPRPGGGLNGKYMDTETARKKLKEAPFFPFGFDILPKPIAKAIQRKKGFNYLIKLTNPNDIMMVALDEDSSIANAFETLGGDALNVVVEGKKIVFAVFTDNIEKLPKDVISEMHEGLQDANVAAQRFLHFNAAFPFTDNIEKLPKDVISEMHEGLQDANVAAQRFLHFNAAFPFTDNIEKLPKDVISEMHEGLQDANVAAQRFLHFNAAFPDKKGREDR